MVIALLLALASGSNSTAPIIVHATTVSSADLAEECSSSRSPIQEDFCTGYILASYDQLALARMVCPPEGFSTYQAAVIGRKAISSQPEQWARHPSTILRDAFKRAFPCR